MSHSDRCGQCGSLRFQRTKLERFVVVDGETYAGTVPGMRCKTCCAEIASPEVIGKFDEVAVLVARGVEAVDPFGIRRAPRATMGDARRGPPRTGASRMPLAHALDG